MFMKCAAGILTCLVLLATNSFGTVFLLDFNTHTDATGGYPNATTWNVYGAPSNINGSTLVSSSGAASAVKVSLAPGSTITDSSNGGTAQAFNNASNNPSWVASTTANAAAGDYFFTSTTVANASFILVFENLTVGDLMSLDLLAARGNSSPNSGFYSYSLSASGDDWVGFSVVDHLGVPVTTNGWENASTLDKAFDGLSDGYNSHRYLTTLSPVTLTSTTLRIRVSEVTSAEVGPYAVLNAVRLAVTPEPGRMVLLMMAGLAWVGRRQRNRAAL
jgi:hypothetical protein